MSKAVIFFAARPGRVRGPFVRGSAAPFRCGSNDCAVGGEKIVKSARSISVVADALAEELDHSAFNAAHPARRHSRVWTT